MIYGHLIIQTWEEYRIRSIHKGHRKILYTLNPIWIFQLLSKVFAFYTDNYLVTNLMSLNVARAIQIVEPKWNWKKVADIIH